MVLFLRHAKPASVRKLSVYSAEFETIRRLRLNQKAPSTRKINRKAQIPADSQKSVAMAERGGLYPLLLRGR